MKWINSLFPEDNKNQNIFIVPFNAQGQSTDLNMHRKASHQIKHNTRSKASPFPDGQIYIRTEMRRPWRTTVRPSGTLDSGSFVCWSYQVSCWALGERRMPCLHNNTTTTGGGYRIPMYISICFIYGHCEISTGRLTLGNGGVLDSNSGGRHFDNGWFKREDDWLRWWRGIDSGI